MAPDAMVRSELRHHMHVHWGRYWGPWWCRMCMHGRYAHWPFHVAPWLTCTALGLLFCAIILGCALSNASVC